MCLANCSLQAIICLAGCFKLWSDLCKAGSIEPSRFRICTSDVRPNQKVWQIVENQDSHRNIIEFFSLRPWNSQTSQKRLALEKRCFLIELWIKFFDRNGRNSLIISLDWRPQPKFQRLWQRLSFVWQFQTIDFVLSSRNPDSFFNFKGAFCSAILNGRFLMTVPGQSFYLALWVAKSFQTFRLIFSIFSCD